MRKERKENYISRKTEDNWTPDTRSTTHSEEVTKKFMQKPLEVTYVQYDLKYNIEIQTERRKSL